MLTSPRKLQKLFIKFISWGLIPKAQNLLNQYPTLEIPWQKAFEETLINRYIYINAVEWILEKSLEQGFIINPHIDNDKIMKQLILSEKMECIRWLIKITKINNETYPWKEYLFSEGQQQWQTKEIRKHILDLFVK